MIIRFIDQIVQHRDNLYNCDCSVYDENQKFNDENVKLLALILLVIFYLNQLTNHSHFEDKVKDSHIDQVFFNVTLRDKVFYTQHQLLILTTVTYSCYVKPKDALCDVYKGKD